MTRDLDAEIGEVTHDEAEQLALACIDAAFNNSPRADGRRFRASIPVNPREDTDVRLMAYIRQQRAKADPPDRAEIEAKRCRRPSRYGRHLHCNNPLPCPNPEHSADSGRPDPARNEASGETTKNT